MINEIVAKLKGKKIAILGFGKEGKSSYKFIRKYVGNDEITIIDGLDKSDDEVCKDDSNVKYIFGKTYLDNLDEYDLIIKTPGISLNFLKKEYLLKITGKITSQLELLLEVNKKNVIGITGTKGKSTTSSLLYEVLKDQGKDVILAGNIGIPVLDEIEKYKDNTILVIEMSSHQLEFVKTSPHIGVVLNLYQDHLDHAGSLEHYHENKMKMFMYQDNNDYAFYSVDNEYTLKNIEILRNQQQLNAKCYGVKFDSNINENEIGIKDHQVILNNQVLYTDGERKLIGDHNLKNIMFILGISYILNLDLNKVKETIASFTPLNYRMEDLGIHHNIHFYVDTIATIPEATMGVISSINNIETLLVGGENRHIDYKPFIEFLKNTNIKNIICMYDTGMIIYDGLIKDSNKNLWFTRDMRDAYKIALENTSNNNICLLSPAASSKDVFTDFEEKGKLFKSLVLGIDTDIKEHGKKLDEVLKP